MKSDYFLPAIHYQVIPDIIVSLFVMLFIYTALQKLQSPETFIMSMKASPMLAPFSTFLAYLIPILEMLLVVLLILPFTRPVGLLGSIALLTLFTLYIVYMLVKSDKLPCTCGGLIQEMGWKSHLLFNSAFILIGTWGYRLIKKQKLIAINQEQPNTCRI